jgi:hypothetical protein
MKITKRSILFSVLIEALMIVIIMLFDHFHRATIYETIFYFLPFILVFFRPQLTPNIWLGYEFLVLLFILNASKWLFNLWIFRKGQITVFVLINILFIVLVCWSFPFSDFGF